VTRLKRQAHNQAAAASIDASPDVAEALSDPFFKCFWRQAHQQAVSTTCKAHFGLI